MEETMVLEFELDSVESGILWIFKEDGEEFGSESEVVTMMEWVPDSARRLGVRLVREASVAKKGAEFGMESKI